MPSKNKQYNLVQSDDLDTRVPLMPDEAFQHGIPFNCKFIGSMDIPRPTSRVEIVAAMRRVRVEFKSKGVKKKKVTLTVSVDGMKTTLRKKNRKRKKRSNSYVDVDGNSSMVVLCHPIYRIFYVSHDSQDVKIFSYIARETSSNVFHCCVFKAANKNQAMRIVRTVGQAFEVCHKLVGTPGEEDESEEIPESDTNLSQSKVTDGSTSQPDHNNKNVQLVQVAEPPTTTMLNNNGTGSSTSLIGDKPPSSSSKSSTPPAVPPPPTDPVEVPTPPQSKLINKPQNLDLTKRDLVSSSTHDLMNLTTPCSSTVPTPTQAHSFFKENPKPIKTVEMFGNMSMSNKEQLSQVHEAQLLKEQLEQQTQNTRAALAQIQLLRDQLAAESAARIEAQARTHQLLIHNKELLDHLQTLVRHIQELEAVTGTAAKERIGAASSNSIAGATGVTLPQVYSSQQHHHHHALHQQQSSPTHTPPPPPPSTLPISFQEIEALRRQNAALLETLIYDNNARASSGSHHYFPALAAHQRYGYPYAYAPAPAPTHLLYSSPFANASASLIMANSNSNQSQSSSTSSSRGVLCGDGATSSNEMLATIFTSSGQPVLPVVKDPGSPFIKPLHHDQQQQQYDQQNRMLLLAPPGGPSSSSLVPKLGQIGRNASADYDGQGAFDDSNLRRNVLGRSVSEKIGHRSELMSQVQRTAWARHTTK